MRSAIKLGLAALLGAFGCNEEAPPPCPAHGCINTAKMSGTVVVDAEIHALDTRFCFETDCRDGAIGFDITTGEPCTTSLANDPWVCAQREGDRAISLRATWPFSEPEYRAPPDGSSFRLLLSDRGSGQVLLDVTRSATYEAEGEDGCPRCWRAEMTF